MPIYQELKLFILNAGFKSRSGLEMEKEVNVLSAVLAAEAGSTCAAGKV